MILVILFRPQCVKETGYFSFWFNHYNSKITYKAGLMVTLSLFSKIFRVEASQVTQSSEVWVSIVSSKSDSYSLLLLCALCIYDVKMEPDMMWSLMVKLVPTCFSEIRQLQNGQCKMYFFGQFFKHWGLNKHFTDFFYSFFVQIKTVIS